MIRFNVRALATAGLAVAMLASSAAAAAAAEGPADEKSPIEAAVGAYQQAYPRITLGAATRAAEQQEARKALYEDLAGKQFGGAWFDPPTGVLHIGATDEATAKRALELGKARGVEVASHVVKRSYDELLELAQGVGTPDTALGKAADGNVGLEVESNLVLAAVPASQVDELARQAPDGVRVIALDPKLATEADLACTSRFNCDTTLRSGVAIWRGPYRQYDCSAGFTARDYSGARFLYTAGHCSNGYGVQWGTGTQPIGPLVGAVNVGPLDAAVIRVTNGLYAPVFGGIAYNEFFPGRQVNVNAVAPNLGFIWPGDLTCLSANFTQPNGFNFCGVIGTAMDPMVRGMVRVNGLDACGGDSGGGWYWLTPTGRRVAYGLHSRSDSGCHGSLGGRRSWFSAMPRIKQLWTPGLNVEVRP